MRVRQSTNVKGKLILLTILVLLFLAFIGVKYLLLDKQNDYGAMRILSVPSSNVFIDNVNVGKTPYEQKMKVGEHIVKLIPSQDATQEATPTAQWEGKVKVFKNSLSYVNRELGDSELTSAGEVYTITEMTPGSKAGDYGELFVDTDPPGAIVSIDNDEKGVASLLIAPILNGAHEVSLYLPGFVRRTQKVNIVEGRRINTVFKLAVDKLQQEKIASLSAPRKTATDSASIATPSASADAPLTPGTKQILIEDTPTGWLRVRTEPTINASEEARVDAGTRHVLLEERPNWYRISYEPNKDGWVAAEYAQIVE